MSDQQQEQGAAGAAAAAPAPVAPNKAAATTARVETNERPEKENGGNFQQQKLAHFYATHNPPSTIICLFIVAICFIPVGSAIIVASESFFEHNIRYDHINEYQYGNCNHNLVTFTSGALSATGGCRSRPTFTLTSDVDPPIHIYYRLVNFYQNYRPYAKSINDNQLQGLEVSRSDLSDCSPFLSPGGYKGNSNKIVNVSGQSKTYAEMTYSPCGAVPWSMFNDTISLFKVDNETVVKNLGPGVELAGSGFAELVCNGSAFNNVKNEDTGPIKSNCSKAGIAFDADTETRFKTAFKETATWSGEGKSDVGGTDDDFHRAGWYADEIGHKIPLATDEDFMVWTRIAGLSDFRKLYRKINVKLTAGTYAMDIIEHYDVKSFAGEKHIVLATNTWVGGRNLVLGGLFITFGGVSCVLAVAFLVWYVLRGPGQRPDSSGGMKRPQSSSS